jgi:hypothetical protein
MCVKKKKIWRQSKMETTLDPFLGLKINVFPEYPAAGTTVKSCPLI